MAKDVKEDKLKALDAAISQIEKQYGRGSVMRLGDNTNQMKVETIPTGSISLDIALGQGGLPKGRIIEIYGPESSGKTTVALHCVAETQKRGGIAGFIDAEHALDPVYAKNIGVDIDNLYISQPDSGEQALEITETMVRSGAVDIIVVDSVAALVPKAEIEGDMGDSHVGLQARLIKLLAGKKDTGPAAEDIEEDKLIVVGDPKQSIYRFTGAELSVYEDVDGMMAKMSDDLAESVSLDTNFRSNKDIVDWVNEKFGKLMGSSYSPMDTDWIVSEKNALHGVYGYAADLETDGKGNPKNYKKEDDVSAVAELVSSLVNNSHCFIEQPVRNEDGTFGKPLLRKIKYSDIMIICRNTKKMKNYAVRFAECDIPVNVQGKFKADDDEVLRNFVLLTEYLADPKNKKKRATAVQIISGIDVTKASIDESKKAEEDLKDLITLFRDNSMNTAAIMRYLLSREELFLPRGKEFSPGRIKEYRIRLNQMVETCLADNDGDISRLSDLMNDYIKKVIKREIPLESNEDALQLMNVHQAKGLTGQIVIIADRTNEDVCKYSGFKSDGKYYPAVRYKKSGKNESGSVLIPSYGNDINRLKQAYTEDRDESVRLQYVAATRAAHALIIMPAIQKDAWFTKDVYDYKCLPDINKWLKDRNADTKTYDLANETEKEEANDNLSALEKNKEKADSDSLSEKQLISITPSELERPGVTGYSATDKGYAKEDRPGGDVFGTVMHRVYELMFTGYARLVGKDPEDRTKSIDRIINRAILENIDDLRTKDDPKAFSEFLSSKMSGRFETTIRPIMDEAEEIYPEWP